MATQTTTTAAEIDALVVGDLVTWFDGWKVRSGSVVWMAEWEARGIDDRERTMVVVEREPHLLPDGEGFAIIAARRYGENGLYVAHNTTTGASILAHGGTLDEFTQFRATFEAE